MPYVSRGPDGAINAVFRESRAEAVEKIPAGHPELTAFLASIETKSSDPGDVTARLQESDLDMVRVLEDLIEILTCKGVILITDLPWQAQEKMMKRERLRELLGAVNQIVDSDDHYLPDTEASII